MVLSTLKFISIGLATLMIMAGCSAGGGSSSSVSSSTNITTNIMGGASNKGHVLTLAGKVKTLAGPPLNSSDGIGSAARFCYPVDIATDGTNLYVTDAANFTIRKVEIATGAVTTLAGYAGVSGSTDGIGSAARFRGPFGITSDGTNLYVADFYTIRKVVIATGAVTTLAGYAGVYGSVSGSGSTDGIASAARFRPLAGITNDGANLYVADTYNQTIRKVEIATGAVTTLAGYANVPGSNIGIGSTDGIGSAARFNYPMGITTDGLNLYVTDQLNNTIRKIEIATGAVTTLAGALESGSIDGTGSAARFRALQRITTDGTNLFVTDGYTIRKVIIASGLVTTYVGSDNLSGSSDGIGSAVRFNGPIGITTDGINLYVADSGNNTIRKVTLASAVVTTMAGSAGINGLPIEASSSAMFKNPLGITTDGANLYVTDTSNNIIVKVVIATGAVTTLAGSAGLSGSIDGTGSAARFNGPMGITTDGVNLYVTDTNNQTIRKVVIKSGTVTTLAGYAGATGSIDGTGSAARFNTPAGLTTDGTNLYMADSGNGIIRQVVITTGRVTTLAGSAGSFGSADGTATTAQFFFPTGITTDQTNLYVTAANTVRKVVIATGAVSTLAGSYGWGGSTDGAGSSARFSGPKMGITTDGINLYVTDSDNQTIRKVAIATGVVTTLTGSAGTNSEVLFRNPTSITTDGTSLYLTDDITIKSIQ